jgi:2-amino-4-hydroxy-6-hydroxymethyldihydropteridine diphosphokinase
MYKVYLGIGGNIGDKQVNFTKVAHLIKARLGEIEKSSSVYETPPWGFNSENQFWNQVLQIKSKMPPENLLVEIHKIETEFGRERKSASYTSREMDIDILYYDDMYIETEKLVIPHPQIKNRKFVLVPLVEIAADFKHPLFRLTNLQLLENCKDESVIMKIDLGNY